MAEALPLTATPVTTFPGQQRLTGAIVNRAFTEQHLRAPGAPVETGTRLLVFGFPLGFHDTLHHMPVARHAIMAATFRLRFQGEGYFPTDGRTYRGIDGAPVVMRAPADVHLPDHLPWFLLGIHSARS